MHIRPYEKLVAWTESHRLCLSVYALIKRLPSDERFRLADQISRAAYSVPMNIAEGSCKDSAKARRNFYEIAAASLEELHYQMRLCLDLGYLDKEGFQLMDGHIQRTSYLLLKLRQSLRTP